MLKTVELAVSHVRISFVINLWEMVLSSNMGRLIMFYCETLPSCSCQGSVTLGTCVACSEFV